FRKMFWQCRNLLHFFQALAFERINGHCRIEFIHPVSESFGWMERKMARSCARRCLGNGFLLKNPCMKVEAVTDNRIHAEIGDEKAIRTRQLKGRMWMGGVLPLRICPTALMALGVGHLADRPVRKQRMDRDMRTGI